MQLSPRSLFEKDLFWRAVLDVLLGLLMLLAPNRVYHMMVYLLAIYTIIQGILRSIGYFRNGRQMEKRIELFVGVLLVVLGICMFTSVGFLASILTYFIGFLLMLFGFIQMATNLLVNPKVDIIGLLVSIAIILFGMIAILAPIKSMTIFLRLSGIVVIVMGFGELGSLLRKPPK